jgi:hypothetical protein
MAKTTDALNCDNSPTFNVHSTDRIVQSDSGAKKWSSLGGVKIASDTNNCLGS